MNILILDTETTGFSPAKGAQLIEVGALLYNVDYRVVIQTLSFLLPCDTNAAEHINGIKPDWTKQSILHPHSSAELLVDMAWASNFIIAHNASFDIEFVKTLIDAGSPFWSVPWICTYKKFPWPVQLTRKRLEDVCVAMGVPYVKAHRALTDCQFIADCFSKIVDLKERLIYIDNTSNMNIITTPNHKE